MKQKKEWENYTSEATQSEKLFQHQSLKQGFPLYTTHDTNWNCFIFYFSITLIIQAPTIRGSGYPNEMVRFCYDMDSTQQGLLYRANCWWRGSLPLVSISNPPHQTGLPLSQCIYDSPTSPSYTTVS